MQRAVKVSSVESWTESLAIQVIDSNYRNDLHY